MKTVLLFVLLFMLISFSYKKECKWLPNGFYKVKSNLANQWDYIIKIDNDNYIHYLNNGDSVLAKLVPISSCTFQLNVIGKARGLDSLLLKSFGAPCITIGEGNGDTVKFKMSHSGNLHITIDEGYLIKLNKL